ncbi:hypothetical protein [Amycolatopsis oliviviridis]|uniref:Lipoprotein n=1 Tax=Amycolatopsis oliviviridis TaxID=1471590 RepID=A0ABQ3LL63_9PSEU|nr:hypothetical protein [Amycolatopsis oliviviridis]GHH17462.1 hypothetical protein GCM10017790_34460 [Amycolatopsis oliviviridis]
MRIRPLGAACAAAALFLIAGCEEQTPGTASPQTSAVPSTSEAPAGSSAQPSASSRPSATAATVSEATKSATGGAVAHSPQGAASVMEEYFHALGAKDLETVCRITGPAFDGGMKECRTLTPMQFGMFSDDDLKKLKAIRVDPAKLQSKGPDKVAVPPAAVAPQIAMMAAQPKTFTMAWRDGTWVVVA